MMRCHLTPVRMANLKKKKQKNPQIKNVGKDMEKSELLYTVGGNVNWYSPCGKHSGGFS